MIRRWIVEYMDGVVEEFMTDDGGYRFNNGAYHFTEPGYGKQSTAVPQVNVRTIKPKED